MLKLENVTTYPLIELLSVRYGIDSQLLLDALISYQIFDYQSLEDFIFDNPVYKIDYDYLERDLQIIKRKVERNNNKGIEPQLYFTKGYVNPTLEYVDKLVKGDKLVFFSPFNAYSTKREDLLQMSIFTIKHLLSHTKENGKNGITYLPGFGDRLIKKLIWSIEFYEAQIMRQAQNEHVEGCNLFELNEKEKTDELLHGNESIKYCLEYILDTASIMIWGPLTSIEKYKLSNIITQISEKKHDNKILDAIFTIIKDYVTLEEVQKGLVKTKVINRFIIK